MEQITMFYNSSRIPTTKDKWNSIIQKKKVVKLHEDFLSLIL